jgi:hypothetical protein
MKAKLFPNRRSPAAEFVTVFNVVMHKAEIVHHFDCRGKWHGMADVAVEAMRDKQAEERAQPFPVVCGSLVNAESISGAIVKVGNRVFVG